MRKAETLGSYFLCTSYAVKFSMTESSQRVKLGSAEQFYQGVNCKSFEHLSNWILWFKKVKANSYIAQYPVFRTIQSALHFTSLTDLFTQTPSRLLWEASSHMLQLMREGCSCTYLPLSIARYSFIQLSELEQCGVE